MANSNHADGGLAAMVVAFVRNESEFYICRFILGVAEAVFFPGVT